MDKCKYNYGDYSCPFDAEEGKDYCIFHLPVKDKDSNEFWKRLANYLIVLIENTEDEKVKSAYDSAKTYIETIEINGEKHDLITAKIPWIFSEKDDVLRLESSKKIEHRLKIQKRWEFVGFQFPIMDEKYNFNGFVFFNVNFWSAQFSGAADFQNTQFGGAANFGRAHFSGAANFSFAHFSGEAYFWFAQFSAEADFCDVQFSDEAKFYNAQFSAEVIFWTTRFNGQANFRHAQFSGAADFREAQFSGAVKFTRSIFRSLIDFTNCSLYNQLLLEGTVIEQDAKILFWNINFVHGVSKVEMDKNNLEGKIIAPAGEIVFKDINKGMDIVSFLHTEVYYNRPYIKFFNVGWEKDPRKFLFDAQFVFAEVRKYTNILPDENLKSLAAIFYLPVKNDKEFITVLTREDLLKFVDLLRLDVERISREIRRFYEDFGNYPDAGDYYIAEMEYRRIRTPLKPSRNFFYRAALELYKCVSNYGESPSKALYWLLGIWSISSILYLFTGFNIAGNNVGYLLSFDLLHPFKIIGDYFSKAIWFSFINLIPGYFRFASQSGQNTSLATTIISITEGILGVIVLTLFLLAVRRRFRR